MNPSKRVTSRLGAARRLGLEKPIETFHRLV